MTTTKNLILDRDTAAKKLRRMALEILENNFGEKELVLAGIRDKGSIVARNLEALLKELSDLEVELVDISLDKDHPGEVRLDRDLPLNDRVIIIVDDVSNSGKTLTYALKPFLAAHPRKIEILVLVERTHTHFPVRPNYVGLSLATTLQEHISVEVKGNEVLGAYLV